MPPLELASLITTGQASALRMAAATLIALLVREVVWNDHVNPSPGLAKAVAESAAAQTRNAADLASDDEGMEMLPSLRDMKLGGERCAAVLLMSTRFCHRRDPACSLVGAGCAGYEVWP